MTRREFIKCTAGLILACGAGFGVDRFMSSFTSDAETAVGPLIVDGLEMRSTGHGCEVYGHGLHLFTVNETGEELLTLADGKHTLEEIISVSGLDKYAEETAGFYITLGKAGYLQNRMEVDLVSHEV